MVLEAPWHSSLSIKVQHGCQGSFRESQVRLLFESLFKVKNVWYHHTLVTMNVIFYMMRTISIGMCLCIVSDFFYPSTRIFIPRSFPPHFTPTRKIHPCGVSHPTWIIYPIFNADELYVPEWLNNVQRTLAFYRILLKITDDCLRKYDLMVEDLLQILNEEGNNDFWKWCT